jgi:hypothetical protein
MDTIIHLDTTAVSMVAGLLIPLLTGVVTKLDSSSAVKSVSTAVLAVIVGTVNALLTSPDAGLSVVPTVYAIVLAAVSAWASYAGLWRPSGVAGAVQGATADFGVGSAK